MLRIILKIFLLIILASAGYLAYGYYNYQKGDYHDLGIRYNLGIFENTINNKLKIEIKDREKLFYGVKIKASGEHKVSQNFSNEEISSLINYANEMKGGLKDFQIKFVGNNICEASFYYSGLDHKIFVPIFIRAELIYTNNSSVNFKFDEVSVGDFKLPKIARERMANSFNEYINITLAGIDIFEIEKLGIDKDKVYFSGTLPTKIEGYE
jgi:hypothetical protein